MIYIGIYTYLDIQDFPGGSVVKNLPANAGNMGSIPESGRSPGGGDGYPTPGFLPEEILMDRGAWWATVQGVAKRQTGLRDSATPSLYPL